MTRPTASQVYPALNPVTGKQRVLKLAICLGSLLHVGRVIGVERASVIEPPRGAEAADASQTIARSAQFLASDALEGRGLQTEGLLRASEYIRDEFRKNGLELWPAESEGFQSFETTTSSELLSGGRLQFRDGDTTSSGTPVDKEAYTALSLGTSGEFDRKLAFVGYGITAPEVEYDDYAGIDVKGRVVVLMRHEPRQADPHSVFDGIENSRHAPLRTKVSNAYEHGAAGVVFVTDEGKIKRERARAAKRLAELEIQQTAAIEALSKGEGAEELQQEVDRLTKAVERWELRKDSDPDALMPFDSGGQVEDYQDFPVAHCKRVVVDELLKREGKPSLSALEQKIDEQMKPQSFLIDDVNIAGEFRIERKSLSVRNVVGVLPGRGALADEAIVVGAHYDHLGRGEFGSAEPQSKEIHNGADDNASGVVALLQIVRNLAAREDGSRRAIIFVGFTAEERGLLGSAHFVDHPPVPLERIAAMVNLDMVGRLRDDKLLVQGFDTAVPLEGWIDECNREFGFDLVKNPGGLGPSDHANFSRRKIPALHLFTGLHSEYHRPADDFELLNLAGIERITQFATELLLRMSTSPEPIGYVEVESASKPVEISIKLPDFGSVPDFQAQGEGYVIARTRPNSPAAEGGLLAGDRIVELGSQKVANLEDFDLALRKLDADEPVSVVVVRKGERIVLEVRLDPRNFTLRRSFR